MRDFHHNMTFPFNCMSSDESPLTCEMFLDEGGLELFLTVLQVMCLTAIVIAQPSATSGRPVHPPYSSVFSTEFNPE